jgi:hypothetical protein
VVDASGRVTREGESRTLTSVPAGSEVVEGIGTEATWLADNLTVGTRYRIGTAVTGPGGRPASFGPDDSVVNGGPEPVKDGWVLDDPVTDGLVDPTKISAFDSFAVRRNPRTMIGVNRSGQVMLAEDDADLGQHRPDPPGGGPGDAVAAGRAGHEPRRRRPPPLRSAASWSTRPPTRHRRPSPSDNVRLAMRSW